MDSVEQTELLARLVNEHYQNVYRFAYRLSGSVTDSEDLVQQTFLVAQTKLNQLKEPDRARSWLFTIVRNLFLKGVQKEGKEATVALDESMFVEAVQEKSETVDVDQLQHLLDDLPEDFRAPVILFYFKEFSYQEIADQLGIPLGTVMSRLSRAKAMLKEKYAVANTH